jgi:peroxiredoxin
MTRTDDINKLPNNLPAPENDGACDHLDGMSMPSIALPSTAGDAVNFANLAGLVVVYIYPRTGRPDQALPTGWNEIPGARGCTPQSCAFRDHHDEILRYGARVFGLSTQSTEYQKEAVERMRLPFNLVSDAKLEFRGALDLPIFEVDAMVLIKRTTIIVNNAVIKKVFYPVFPPDQNANEVLKWLAGNG